MKFARPKFDFANKYNIKISPRTSKIIFLFFRFSLIIVIARQSLLQAAIPAYCPGTGIRRIRKTERDEYDLLGDLEDE